jgi:uncharacterized protein
MLRPEEIDELVRRIVACIRPQKVVIFGSYAKGTATARSDLDVFVVKETEMPRARRADELRPMLSQFLIPVDVHVYTPEEEAEYGKEPFSFVDSILKWGKTVYRDGEYWPASPDDRVTVTDGR